MSDAEVEANCTMCAGYGRVPASMVELGGRDDSEVPCPKGCPEPAEVVAVAPVGVPVTEGPVIVVTVSPPPPGAAGMLTFAAEFEGDPGSRTSGWASTREALGALLMEECPPNQRRHGILIRVHHVVRGDR